MASQPLNTSISVFRQLRSERDGRRQESVKAITDHLRALLLQVPGQEIPAVVNLTLQAGTSGETSYNRAGRPLVVGVRQAKDFQTVNSLTGVDFFVEIGQDRFIQNTAAGLASDAAGADLFKQAQTAATSSGGYSLPAGD